MCRVVVLLSVVLLVPGTAFAHAILIDSTPAVNASVPPGHEAVTLRFNSRIDRERSRLTLIAPDKSQTRIPIAPNGPPDVMHTAADLRPGAYTIRWQVLAVDGHITRGDVPFTVAAP
jgi:methionine-rich copper-binding protein CopC